MANPDHETRDALIARLRGACVLMPDRALANEAADEIERLRGCLHRVFDIVQYEARTVSECRCLVKGALGRRP